MGRSQPLEGELSPASCRALLACIVGNFLCSAPIVTSTIGAFLIPVTQEFGWSRSSFSLVFTIVAVIGVAAFPVAGGLADRIGPRRVVLVGNLVFAASIAAVGTMGHYLSSLYLLYALVAITMAFSSSVILSRVVASWFVKRRGLMLGLTAGIGNGVGCAVMPIVTLIVITHYGWREAYLALGALVALVGFPTFWFLLREKQSSPGCTQGAVPAKGMQPREVRRDPLFWVLALALALGAGTLTAVFTHVVPLLMDRKLAIQSAALTVSGLAIGSATWQVSFGRILDSLKTPRLSAIGVIAAIIGMFLLARAQGSTSLFVAGLLIGVASGTEFGMLPYVIPRYFGLRSYNETYGAIFGLVMLTTGLTPTLMDVFYDHFKNYDAALVAIGSILILTGCVISKLPVYRFSKNGERIGGPLSSAQAPLAANWNSPSTSAPQ